MLESTVSIFTKLLSLILKVTGAYSMMLVQSQGALVDTEHVLLNKHISNDAPAGHIPNNCEDHNSAVEQYVKTHK